MTATQRMELLHERLRTTAADADVRLLAEGQIVVSRNLIRNPDFERGGKSATYVPGPDGYEVYIACRPAETHARQAAQSQLMTGPSHEPPAWDSRTMRLRLDQTATSGRWVVRDARGEVVTVSAAAGSAAAAVLDDVNAVLSDAEAVLLT
jgi:hypothetical protein